jgi:hypothetical protein
MKMPRLIFTTTLLLILIVVSCNVLKKEDNATDVRKFVSSFQASLSQDDNAILKQFQSSQSKESILSAIRILQNKESEYIDCSADFSGFAILGTDDLVTIQIHAVFQSKNIDEEYKNDATFEMKLKRENKSFVIAELKAEEFYEAFALMRNEMQWPMERETENKLRRPIYARAKELQHKFDSVIWFARYKQVTYYYVATGTWNLEAFKENRSTSLMGIVDEQGNEVIPVEYDFIGTIGFSEENIVEVGQNGRLGYFDILKREVVIAPQFDLIIPYHQSGAIALVKQDSVYGWLNGEKQFVTGFPSKEAEQFVRTYSFLPADLRISYELEGLCESPDAAQIGSGCVMPSSYLVASGIFNRVINGITTTKIPMNGWTEYIETKGSKLKSISENLNALVTTVTERYLEGREEFYTENQLMFVNDNNELLGKKSIIVNGEFEIERIGERLIEIKSQPTEWFGDDESEDTENFPMYSYFEIKDGSIEPLESKRKFVSTQFIKLDSAFLSTSSSWYNPATQQEEQTTFLSLSTINYMRNEILADYGYLVFDYEAPGKFRKPDSGPRFNSIDEFRSVMTDIDRHNIDFLERMIVRMEGTPLQ